MKPKYTKSLLLPLACSAQIFVAAGPATAAGITWGSPTLIAADTDVSTSGTLISAVDVNGSSPVTLNGVTFATGTGSFTFSFAAAYPSFGASGPGYNALSANYQSLLTTGVFQGGGTPSVTINGLTVGRTYAVQIWCDDSRSGGGYSSTLTSTGGNAVSVLHNNTNAAGGVGRHVTGTFTADATTQSFTLSGSSVINVLNAIQLRDVTPTVVYWNGNLDGTWNTSALNWAVSPGGSATTYADGNAVTFADSATGTTTVNVTAPVSPFAVVVNNSSQPYTIGGSPITGSSGLTKQGSNTLTLTGANTFTGPISISAGGLIIGGSGQLGGGAYGSQIANNGSLTFDSSAAQSLSGGISGTGALLKNGSGTLTLGASNSYSGATNVNAGSLILSGSIASSPTVTIASGATLEVSGTAYNQLANGSGKTWNVAGTLNITGAANVLTLPATLNLNGGTLSSTTSGGVNFGSYHAVGPTITCNGTGNTINCVDFGLASNNPALIVNTPLAGDTLTASTVIKGVGGGTPAGLTKNGAGTVTLSGANTYTGATTINAGTLVLTGAAALASNTISVAGGAVFDVSGLSSTFTLGSGRTLTAGRTSGFATDVNGSLTIDAATLKIGGSTAVAGTLMESGNLTLNNASLTFDLAPTATPGAGVNDLIAVTGNLDLTGVSNLTVNKLGTTLAAGSYHLITCTGTVTGTASELNLVGLPDTVRQSYALAVTATGVDLVVTGNGADLVWTGANGTHPSFWDVDTTVNWSGDDTKYLESDAVLFNDSAASTTVEPQNFLQPGTVEFNNTTTAYSLTGSFGIDGTTGLTKNGTGSLTIQTDNAYTGITAINGGTLTLSGAGTLGGVAGGTTVANLAALQLQGGITVGAEPLTLNGDGVGGAGALRNLSGANTYGGKVTLGSSARINSDSDSMTLSNTGAITGSGFNLALGGAGNTSIVSPINIGAGSLSKDGTGTVTLGGNSGYSGSTTVNAGSLIVSGSIASSSSVTVASGATLEVSATTYNALPNGAGKNWTVAGLLNITGAAEVLTLPATLTLNGGTLGSTSSGGATFGSYHAVNSTITANGTGNTINSVDFGLANNFGPFTLSTPLAGDTLNVSTVVKGVGTGVTPAGLIKTGLGTVTLSGANTYLGITTVNGGTLNVTGSLRLKPTTNGTVNTIGGSASLALNGTLNLDLATANTTAGNSWLLVDTANLSETYGGGFAITSTAGTFAETGSGVWTLTSGSNLWTFTESTGLLTVGTASGYQAWIDSYSTLTGDDKLPGADPDHDGMSNLAEFAFKGDPTAGASRGLTASATLDANGNTTRELTLTVAVRTGATFAGSPLSAVIDGVTYTIEGSLDLATFATGVTETTALTPAQSGLPDITGSGWTYHTFMLNGSEGLAGKGFLRAKAVAP